VRYVLLVYADERKLPGHRSPEARRQYGALRRELLSTGRMRLIGLLAGTESATTVRVRDGEVLISDGPFAETREQLGGFLVLDVDRFEDALALAPHVPRVTIGAVEIRSVAEMAAPAGGRA
jgi:hypothetical protein